MSLALGMSDKLSSTSVVSSDERALPVVPVNTVAPALEDVSLAIGDEAAASEGTWSHSPTSFRYRGFRDGVFIEEADDETYVVTEADLGCKLKRRTIANNAAGSSAWVFSDESDTVTEASEADPVSGNGTLQGYTDPGDPGSEGSDGTQPADLRISFNAGALVECQSAAFNVQVSITDAGLGNPQRTFTFAIADPLDGSTWVDSTAFLSEADIADALAAALVAWDKLGLSALTETEVCVVTYAQQGESEGLNGTTSSGNVALTGGGSGTNGTDPTDPTDPSGQIEAAEVIPAQTGKAITLAEVSFVASPDGFPMEWEVVWAIDDVPGDQVAFQGSLMANESGTMTLSNLTGPVGAALLARITVGTQLGGAVTVSASGTTPV